MLAVTCGFWPRNSQIPIWTFAVDKEKGPKNPPKNPPRIHPGFCSEKFPSDFCRSLFLTKTTKCYITNSLGTQLICSDFSADGIFLNLHSPIWVQRRKIHPKKSTQNKKVHLNKFIWTISVGFLTRVTGKKAKVRVNFSKKFAWTRCFFGISGFWVGCWASMSGLKWHRSNTPKFESSQRYHGWPAIEEQNTPMCTFSLGDDHLFQNLTCDLAGLLQSPKTPKPRKYEKNTKSPHPGLAPENTAKIPKKYENGPKTAIFGPFLCFFFGIFSVFPGVNPGWGILYFFRIFGVWGFSGSVAGPQYDDLRLVQTWVDLELAK